MKSRSVYGLSILVLVLYFWLPGLINPLGSMALAQPASKPPKAVSTLQAQTERSGDITNIPPPGPNIGWRLVGNAVTDGPSGSFAIMEYQSTSRQGAFREGDRLGELRIKKILPDRVVIDTRNGKEMLSLGAGGKDRGPSPPEQVASLKREEIDSRYGD
jgi:hypothetical protein